MGFIRDVRLLPPEESHDARRKIYIIYTLTTPGCPLAGMIQSSFRTALETAHQTTPFWTPFDVSLDVYAELTFDPPWTLEDMSEEERAELGF